MPEQMDHGMGAIQSPPDDRDLIVNQQLAEELAAAVAPPPDHWLMQSRPPVRDQTTTPQCVAYSSGAEQAKNDRDEAGRWVDFNEARFFTQIGGTPAGAFMRNALQRLKDYGYPEQDATPSPQRHKIGGYYRIEQTRITAKLAIIRNKGILAIGPWWPSWLRPVGPEATLPNPGGTPSGHAWWAVGYDRVGVTGQNSWGTAWGNNGLFRMPWYFFINYMWEFWATTDAKTIAHVRTRQ